MSLLGIIEKRSTLANPAPWLLNAFGGGAATAAGIVVSEQNALQLPAVFSCVNVITEAIGALPLNLYLKQSDGGQTLVSNLNIADLMANSPNDEMGAMSFKATVLGWTLTWGNGYAEIERNNAGFPLALHPLAPNRIIPRRRPGDYRIQYYTSRNPMLSAYNLEQPILETAPIDRDDMFHLAGLGWDGIMGYSPIAMARQTIGTGMAAELYGAHFFANGGVPSGVLESKTKISDTKKLAEQWKAANGGGAQRGTAVLDMGMTYKAIGIPPEESQFLLTKKYSKGDICGIYKVPPHMIGELDKSTNNNIEQQSMDFVQNCLLGWIVRFEEEANRKLLTAEQRAAGYFFAFDLDARLRADIKTRFESYAVAKNGGFMNGDEIRIKERMNPMPDGLGKIYTIPMNLMSVKSLLNPPASPLPTPATAPTAGPTPERMIAGFRALLIDAVARTVTKETQAIRRAAKKPDTFATTVRDFYEGHADHIKEIVTPVANTFAELYGIPFPTVRDVVGRVSAIIRSESITALAEQNADVEKLMTKWEQERPAIVAQTIIKEIGL